MASRVLLALLVAVVAADITGYADGPAFKEFIEKYNRMYSTPSEVAGRFAIFKDNLYHIRVRNEKAEGKTQKGKIITQQNKIK